MKKLILFIFGFVFAGLVFADYPMDGQYHIVSGNNKVISFNAPIIKNGIDIKIKPFVCDFTTNYQSSIAGFAAKYYIQLNNFMLYRPNNFPSSPGATGVILYANKGITYILKTSGGKINDIYDIGQLYIINYGCSPYDPDCKHNSDPNWHGDDLIVSCRILD